MVRYTSEKSTKSYDVCIITNSYAIILPMIAEVETLPEDIVLLKEIIVTQRREYESYVHILEEQVRLLKAKVFGRKSDKLSESSGEQLQLFDEIEATPPEPKEVNVPAHSRKRGGRCQKSFRG